MSLTLSVISSRFELSMKDVRDITIQESDQNQTSLQVHTSSGDDLNISWRTKEEPVRTVHRVNNISTLEQRRRDAANAPWSFRSPPSIDYRDNDYNDNETPSPVSPSLIQEYRRHYS